MKLLLFLTVHIIGFHTHSFYLWWLLGKLPNLTQSTFKRAGPVLTHNLHSHRFLYNQLWERLLQKSILVRNIFFGICWEQNQLTHQICTHVLIVTQFVMSWKFLDTRNSSLQKPAIVPYPCITSKCSLVFK